MSHRLLSQLAAGGLAALFPFMAVGEGPNLSAEINAISPQIMEVRQCGRWVADSDGGHIRILIGQYATTLSDELYVQWVSDVSQTRKIIRSLSFPEFNGDHAEYMFTPSSLTCRKVGSDYRISIRATNGHEPTNSKLKVTISINDSGKYRLKIDQLKSNKAFQSGPHTAAERRH